MVFEIQNKSAMQLKHSVTKEQGHFLLIKQIEVCVCACVYMYI